MASIDQSLKRTGLDYFDIFYSHRYDPQTPVEETAQALIDIVRQGKALYIGLSKYPEDKAMTACEMMKSQQVPCLIYQSKYSMLFRESEKVFIPLCRKFDVGYIAFCPLAQGLLTDRYLNGIPESSRAAKPHGYLKKEEITPEIIRKIMKLNAIAEQRGQSLAEMSLAWLVNKKELTSVIIGTSSVNQLKQNLNALNNTDFSSEELHTIDSILNILK